MSTITDLIAANQYQSGYHGNGPRAPARATPDQRQATALKLLQFKAQLDKQQAEAAITQRKKELWDQVGKPNITDKTTAGDVTDIVDNGTVGGREADVVNDGTQDFNPQDFTGEDSASQGASDSGGSTLVDMVANLAPTINSSGNMVLAKKKNPKPYDETKTFAYAKRLADQGIIESGKNRRDISPAAYSQMIKDNISKAEQFLYGKTVTPPPKKDPDQTGIMQAMLTGFQTATQGDTADAAQSDNGGAQPSPYQEGQTAINQKTGKRLVFRGGKWVNLN